MSTLNAYISEHKYSQWLLGILGAVVLMFLWQWNHVNSLNEYIWDSTESSGTEISIFPTGGASKNYRLQATVDAHKQAYMFKRGFNVYLIKYADWPDGGYLTFSECTVTSENMTTSCRDQDGKMWEVELTTPPTEPEVDSSSGN